jgi:hypothetical protein
MAQAQEKTACKNTQKRALFKDKSVLIANKKNASEKLKRGDFKSKVPITQGADAIRYKSYVFMH